MVYMSDKNLIKNLLDVKEFLFLVKKRFSNINSYEDFIKDDDGLILLDSISMRLQAIGEIIKKIYNKNSELFIKYPEIDWKGVINFRDKISHHYVDIDAEEIFFICYNELTKLENTINKILKDLK